MCTGTHVSCCTHVSQRSVSDWVCFLFLPSEFWGFNSGCQVWWLSPALIELYIFRSLSTSLSCNIQVFVMDSSHYVSLAGCNLRCRVYWVWAQTSYLGSAQPSSLCLYEYSTHSFSLSSLSICLFYNGAYLFTIFFNCECVCKWVCMWVCASCSMQRSEDSLWEVIASFCRVHPEGHSQELLSTEPSHWPQQLFICLLLIWIFKRKLHTSFGLWIMYFFMDTGFWKKAWFSLIKSVRNCWGKAKLWLGSRSLFCEEAEVHSVRKLRLLTCLVCYRKGSNRDFD